MMKVSGTIVICCAALTLVLTSVSAVPRLNSIDDLKKVDFGQSVPTRGLVLLHWFANIVDIDNNNIIRLPFDPDSGDYGSHHYGNYERILDPLPRGNARYRYFTVGNIFQGRGLAVPYHVVHYQSGNEERNRNRIIIRVREQNVGSTIDQVYITQHYETSDHMGTQYDPEETYQVTVNLLRRIREFPLEGNQMSTLADLTNRFGSNADNSQLRNLIKTWKSLACLGLFLIIVIEEKHSPAQRNNRPKPAARRNTDVVVNIPETRDFIGCQLVVGSAEITLKVMAGTNGKARIVWDNVPRHLLNEGVMVALYKNNEDEDAMISKHIRTGSGSLDTSVPLNEGLQVRLHERKTLYCFWSRRGEEKCRGPEFKNPMPVNIADYDAKLQLFVKDGKACARLYVKKSFREWRTEFKKSWVGFYSSAQTATKDYEWWQWQWAKKFQPNPNFEDLSYDIYEYRSGMAAAPGVQARFILQGEEMETARTPVWGE
ncbi:uncharacterized protein LOC127530240 [Acanthochromis polyacanthus]|uniref:uncharacterized protein LOC127530240 n=1 Tax=Acanthochromis polyacanthus TaxID=80966 RepID=UPI00223474C2|nr:uncharacterized protein LOC127530240 [Acanthochromis polyacanthus]XP_051797020.1 uncharacterized protein LOC127530240 [Acanthochromis polyacanthus]